MHARTEWQNGLQKQGSVWNANADGIMRLPFFLATVLNFVSVMRDESCSQQSFVQEGLSFNNCFENKTNKKPQPTKNKYQKPLNPKTAHLVSMFLVAQFHLVSSLSFPQGTEWERL